MIARLLILGYIIILFINSVTAIGLDRKMAGLPDVIPFRVLICSCILTALELGLWALVQKLRRS